MSQPGPKSRREVGTPRSRDAYPCRCCQPSGAFEIAKFKQSGQDRMWGLAVLDDLVDYKHVALVPAAAGGDAA